MKSVLSRFSESMLRKYTSLNLSTVRYNHLLLQRFFHCNFLFFVSSYITQRRHGSLSPTRSQLTVVELGEGQMRSCQDTDIDLLIRSRSQRPSETWYTYGAIQTENMNTSGTNKSGLVSALAFFSRSLYFFYFFYDVQKTLLSDMMRECSIFTYFVLRISLF